MQALHQIFSSVDRNKLRNDNDFIAFVQRNRYWIYYYCTWANIRDDWLNQNPLNSRKKEDHLEPSFPSFVSDQIIDFLNPKDKENETAEEIGCLFQAWVQYQCHLQLKEVSEYAQEKHFGGMANYRASEGKVVEIPYKGSAELVIQEILGGVRSTMSYIGARRLKDIPKCTTFYRVNRQLNEVFGKS